MRKELLENVRNSHPLIHNITNYVTVNDCANILLACGGSPIMADDAGEVEEIAALCGGLVLNIGTLDARTVPAMLAAGRRSNALGHPVVLDPVGAGASALRTGTALELLEQVRFSVIRGNISEIRALALGGGSTQGVDADADDAVRPDTLDEAVHFVQDFARRTGAAVAVTGAVDIVADGEKAYCIYNGHPMMSRVTGTGCQLSALTAVFAAAAPGHVLEAAASAVCAMGVCGELAHERMGELDGNAAYRSHIIDAVYRLDGETLDRRADYKIL